MDDRKADRQQNDSGDQFAKPDRRPAQRAREVKRHPFFRQLPADERRSEDERQRPRERDGEKETERHDAAFPVTQRPLRQHEHDQGHQSDGDRRDEDEGALLDLAAGDGENVRHRAPPASSVTAMKISSSDIGVTSAASRCDAGS